MSEHQLRLTGHLVRAVLEGRKTQTRRPVKPQPPEGCGSLIGPEWYGPTLVNHRGEDYEGPQVFGVYDQDGEWGVKCPFGSIGDLLWVRETWAITEDIDGLPVMAYRAGGTRIIGPDGASVHHGEHRCTAMVLAWKPSIHMPKWACRLWLEITGVRVERVQEISEEDAMAEGVGLGFVPAPHPQFSDLQTTRCVGYRPMFCRVWDECYSKPDQQWSANPWVWVLDFRKVER